MKFKYHGSLYRVVFAYNGIFPDGRRTTLAVLEVWNPKTLTWEDTHTPGLAMCSTKDVFVKEKGRKVALAKLFKKMGMNKEDRFKFWRLYVPLGMGYFNGNYALDIESGIMELLYA